MTLLLPGRKHKDAATLRADFLSHRCTPACLILESEAMTAGLVSKLPLSPSELQESSLILNLRSESKKRKAAPDEEHSNKQSRSAVEHSTPNSSFPVILTQNEKDDIVREFRASTSNAALKRYECSFCGKFELACDVKMRNFNDLDISLLEKAVDKLRETSQQHAIQPYKLSSLLNGSSYVLCHLCNLSVSYDKFQSLPIRSYANGLWIGDVPEELQNLTFLEEQCIARARATKCMYKIHLGPTGQLAARGNVCILPQD
ncbi:hypothetical protein R3P38DRAFT_2557841, partial [Favolaschia claudopus]